MSDLEQVVSLFLRENAKARVEREVLKHLVAALMSRHAREHENPNEYIMTLTAGAASGYDNTQTDDELARMAFEHGSGYCNEIENFALSLLSA